VEVQKLSHICTTQMEKFPVNDGTKWEAPKIIQKGTRLPPGKAWRG